jgi:integrase/recombinase XerD
MWLSEVGHQRPNGPSARTRALAAIRSFFKYAHRAGLLRDNPALDVPLPKIRMGEVRALSNDECDRLLRIVATNPSPFRKVRDRAMIVTFLLTGARLREIYNLTLLGSMICKLAMRRPLVSGRTFFRHA